MHSLSYSIPPLWINLYNIYPINKETKNIISKVKKGGFEKIVQYIKAKNITDNFNRIVYTILAIYYIEKTKANSIKEYRLVLNKGKKFNLKLSIEIRFIIFS